MFFLSGMYVGVGYLLSIFLTHVGTSMNEFLYSCTYMGNSTSKTSLCMYEYEFALPFAICSQN